jgi:hypothetical protein
MTGARKELTVLDYVKALLTPWRGAPPRIPEDEPGAVNANLPDSGSILEPVVAGAHTRVESRTEARAIAWPWRSVLAISFALLAQRALEPSPDRTWTLGVLLYLVSAGWLAWAVLRGEWQIVPFKRIERREDPFTIRQAALWISLPLVFLAFLALGGNQFNWLNLILWLSALGLVLYAFWLPHPAEFSWIERAREFVSRRVWNLRISTWTLLFLAGFALAAFFRLYHLVQVPPEMVSDHAEKLLDIWDVLHGQTRIFFPRNTGREAIQMYLTAGVIRIFGTGYSYLSLKIGMAIAGLVTLLYVYLLGVEVGNKRVGLAAMIFTGIAYWPNVITRMALRFALYPLFVAPTLYYLIRGIRRSSRNDFILAGLFLGIGLHGYTPFRIVPFVVAVAVGLYLIHGQSKGLRKQTIWAFLLLGLVALVVFLPLLRYWIDNPDVFSFRAFSRLGSIESPLPGPPLAVFLKNLWNSIRMFSWDDGEIWPVSVPHRPALDVVSGALFNLGILLLLVRYIRQRNWSDLFLILSIPLLMLPSILSLAFPSENPALNRSAGAFIPVFVVVAIALDGLMTGIERSATWTARTLWRIPTGSILAWLE